MTLKIVKYGQPVLRQKGKAITEITDQVRELAQNMLETMRAANGVGLAAQQVGAPVMLTVIDVAGIGDRPSTMSLDGKPAKIDDWMPLILLNPVLELGTEKEEGSEGCLSFPEISAEIVRSKAVKARAQLIDGRAIEFDATGLLARALQHEVDHLNGVLFIDRMNSATKASLSGKLKRIQRESGAR